MKIQACKVKNLFGSNDYCEGKIASHIITVDKINYIPFDFVQRTGFIYDLEDIEEIDYTPAFKSGLEPIKNIKRTTLAVSYKNIFGSNNYSSEYDHLSFTKDGIKYFSLDALRKTTLMIMPCDLQEVDV